MITTILWDVDGTLLNFLYSQRHALTHCFEKAGLTITEEILEGYSRINDFYWKRLELGEVTKEQLVTGRFRTLFETYQIEGVDVSAFQREYEDGLANIYAFIDGAPKICMELAGQVKQYVITNGISAVQRSKLKLSGLDQLMDGIFISEEVGVPKPGKAFFDLVLAQIGEKDKSRILVVGDSLSSDIKGGVNAGLKTCWFRPDDTQNDTPWKPDYEISRLDQLPDILKQEA